MIPEPQVSATTFVVAAPNRRAEAGLVEKLTQLGRVEPLAGYPGRYVLHLDQPSEDPERCWIKLHEVLGPEVEVEPVFLSADGSVCIPTGTLTVRFRTPPSDRELRDFARTLGLKVDERNAFVPSQVSFRPTAGARVYFPDILKRIQRDKDHVVRAWPETLGRYQRTSG
jgi:hypothetical protein